MGVLRELQPVLRYEEEDPLHHEVQQSVRERLPGALRNHVQRLHQIGPRELPSVVLECIWELQPVQRDQDTHSLRHAEEQRLRFQLPGALRFHDERLHVPGAGELRDVVVERVERLQSVLRNEEADPLRHAVQQRLRVRVRGHRAGVDQRLLGARSRELPGFGVVRVELQRLHRSENTHPNRDAAEQRLRI